jgi:hypothetical protein
MTLALAEAVKNIRTAAADKNQKQNTMLDLGQIGDNEIITELKRRQ